MTTPNTPLISGLGASFDYSTRKLTVFWDTPSSGTVTIKRTNSNGAVATISTAGSNKTYTFATAIASGVDYIDVDMTYSGETASTRVSTIEPITPTVPLPTVNAGADRTTVQGTAITLTATESGTVASREWRVISGPAFNNLVLSTGITANWSGSTVGTFVVRYTATNETGSASDDVTVTTTAPATTPVATIPVQLTDVWDGTSLIRQSVVTSDGTLLITSAFDS